MELVVCPTITRKLLSPEFDSPAGSRERFGWLPNKRPSQLAKGCVPASRLISRSPVGSRIKACLTSHSQKDVGLPGPPWSYVGRFISFVSVLPSERLATQGL